MTALLAIPATVSAAEASTKKEAPPNILFILTDQQHANMLSCAGNPYLKTRALDTMARSGIRFTH